MLLFTPITNFLAGEFSTQFSLLSGNYCTCFYIRTFI